MAAVLAVAAAWLLAAPATADLAAQAYRAWLWDAEGWTVWNAQWYGGHHVPGYSLLFPPLAGWLGAALAVAVSGAASAVALVALGSLAPPRRRTAVRWLLASAAAANLVVGRGPFALGLAFGAFALLLDARERRAPAAAASLACVAASPVAGLFLCVLAAGLAAVRPYRPVSLVALAAPAAAGGMALGALFPEGGAERFAPTAFWPLLGLSVAAATLLRGRLRAAAAAYLALLVAAFVIESPLGHNVTRLAVLAGPAALAARGRGPGWAVVLVAAGLVYLQWLPAVRALAESRGDPATAAAYHAPLLEFLDRAAAPGDRVEVVHTRNHWDAVHVAPHWAMARGWERQLDVKVNSLFYDDGPLTPARYEAWLRRERVRWVALPDAPLDYSARAEARLVAAAPAFLRPAFVSEHWRVYELRDPPSAATIVAAGPSELRLAFDRPGRVVLPRRHTRYWRVAEGRATISRAGDFIAVDAPEPGAVRLVARL